MLSISQSSNYYYCLEWLPTELGVEVVKFKKIKTSLNIDDENLIEYIIDNFNPTTKADSNSLSISLNINNVQISCIKIEPKIALNEYVAWYEKNILDIYILEKFDIYYYPISNNNFCSPYPDCGEGPITSEEEQYTSECFECSETNGDINNDNVLDILDIVSTVNCILSVNCNECSDIYDDGTTNVIDISLLVDVIINN